MKSDPVVHVTSIGPFGEAVSNYLKSFSSVDLHETVWNGTVRTNPQNWAVSSVEVVAAHRPVPNLCKFLGQLSYVHKYTFIPLIIDSGVLRLGPILVPGHSACWNCWELRSQQHAVSPQERIILQRFYDSNWQAGPRGYLEPFAMMGAAQIDRLIRTDAEPVSIAGRIWQIDLFTKEVETGQLIGVHDCQYCGLHRPVQVRTYLEIDRQLAFLSKHIESIE